MSLDVALPVTMRKTAPAPTATPPRPLSATSTVLGPVPTGPPSTPPLSDAFPKPEATPPPAAPVERRARPTKEEKARRRRRRARLAGAFLAVVLVAVGGGAYLGWRYLPARQDPTSATPVLAAPAPSAAPTGAGPAPSAPSSPTQPRITLTLLCNLKTPTTCAGRGFSQSYKSEVTTSAGEQLYDGCFDYLTVTGPAGVVQQDSFGCNTGNPIYLNQNRPLPDGQYRIDERAQAQDGQSTQASLTFSVRS
jgi:hypothetical protein